MAALFLFYSWGYLSVYMVFFAIMERTVLTLRWMQMQAGIKPDNLIAVNLLMTLILSASRYLSYFFVTSLLQAQSDRALSET